MSKTMKNLPRALKWLIAIGISIVCLIVCLIGVFWVVVYIAFNPGRGEFVLRAIIFGVVVVCLALSYIYVIKISQHKSRVGQVYAIIALLALSVYVFSEYQTRQEEQAIRVICARHNEAMTEGAYETAYELMSPDYRQTHSLAEFIIDKRWFTCSPNMNISILHPVTGKASISQGGSLRRVISLEKKDHQWYFTGEARTYQG